VEKASGCVRILIAMQAMQSAVVWLNVIQMRITFLGADKISSLKLEKILMQRY
jgi:hypothetical protein